MTVIVGIMFAIIGLYEWRFMLNKQRKRRTILIVLGYTAVSFACFEVLYVVREHWRVMDWIEALFGPLQQLLKIES